MKRSSPIRRATSLCGGQSALARKLGITPQAIQHWCATGVVPPTRVLEIEKATGGQVTRNELRPDLYPEERAA